METRISDFDQRLGVFKKHLRRNKKLTGFKIEYSGDRLLFRFKKGDSVELRYRDEWRTEKEWVKK